MSLRHQLALQHILADTPDHPALEIPSTAVTLHGKALGITRGMKVSEWQEISVDEMGAALNLYAFENNLLPDQLKARSETLKTAILDIEDQFHALKDIANLSPAVRAAEAARQVWGSDIEIGLWMPSPRGKEWEKLEEQYSELIPGLEDLDFDPFDFVAHALYVNDPRDPSATPWKDLDSLAQDARNVLRLWDGVIEVRPMLWHRTELARFGVPRSDEVVPNLESGRLLTVDPNLDSYRVMLEVFEAGGVETILWWEGSDTRTIRYDPEGLALSLTKLGLGEDDQEPPGPPDGQSQLDRIEWFLLSWRGESNLRILELDAKLDRILTALEERPKRRGLRWPWGER